MISAAPEILGSSGEGVDFVGVGLWSITKEMFDDVSKTSGIPLAQSRHWFDSAFGVERRLARVG